MNNDNKPSAVRDPHRTPPFAIRVDLPASARTLGGRFHAALGGGPLRYKVGFDAYRLRQDARQTISDRDTGMIHHDRHPVWPEADLTNAGAYAQVLLEQGRSTIGATVRVDRERARIGQVTDFFARNAIPASGLDPVHGHFLCATDFCGLGGGGGHEMNGGLGTGSSGHGSDGGHGNAGGRDAETGHEGAHGHGAAMLVSGDAFAQANTNVSAAANASLRLADGWLVTLGAGRAVRIPSALERYADRFPAVKFQTAAEFVGNPALVPEKSVEVNAGTMLYAGQASLEVDVFLRRVDDYITVAPDPNLARRLDDHRPDARRRARRGADAPGRHPEPDRRVLRQPPQLAEPVHGAADCGSGTDRVCWGGGRVPGACAAEAPGRWGLGPTRSLATGRRR